MVERIVLMLCMFCRSICVVFKEVVLSDVVLSMIVVSKLIIVFKFAIG